MQYSHSKFCKQFSGDFQVPLAFVALVVNLYSLLALMIMKKLRKPEFILVLLQTVVDFCFTGLLALFYYSSQIAKYGDDVCESTRQLFRRHFSLANEFFQHF